MRLSDSKVEGTFEIYTLMDFGSIFVAEKRMQRRERRFSVDFFLEKTLTTTVVGCSFHLRVEIERGEFAKSRQKLHLSWD